MQLSSYNRTIMIYGIIFWGHSTHSDNIFSLQKRIIIYNGNQAGDSCVEHFKNVEILP